MTLTNADKYDTIKQARLKRPITRKGKTKPSIAGAARGLANNTKKRLMFPKGTRPNPVTRWTKQSIAGAALNLKKNKKTKQTT